MKVTVIRIILIGSLGTVTKGFVLGLGNTMCGDHTNYSIIKIGQNTEESPGDLWRLAVTQTSVRNHRLTLVSKTLKE